MVLGLLGRFLPTIGKIFTKALPVMKKVAETVLPGIIGGVQEQLSDMGRPDVGEAVGNVYSAVQPLIMSNNSSNRQPQPTNRLIQLQGNNDLNAIRYNNTV
jgi:hypothetical protein